MRPVSLLVYLNEGIVYRLRRGRLDRNVSVIGWVFVLVVLTSGLRSFELEGCVNPNAKQPLVGHSSKPDFACHIGAPNVETKKSNSSLKRYFQKQFSGHRSIRRLHKKFSMFLATSSYSYPPPPVGIRFFSTLDPFCHSDVIDRIIEIWEFPTKDSAFAFQNWKKRKWKVSNFAKRVK